MLALLLSAAACGEQSRVDPEAAVTVTGLVVAPDGAAAVGRAVRLGTGITVGEGAFAVLTVGLSCTTGACTGNVRDSTTDAAGRYEFEIQGKETQSSFGEAVSVLVSASGRPAGDQLSGPVTSARFRVQTEQVGLPALELVDPGLVLEATAGVTARWSSPRPGPYELTFEQGLEVPVWLARTAESAAAVDARVLEDTSGRAVVAGGYEEAIEGSQVEVRWRSPGTPYAAGAGAPPSRGRPCQFVDAAGVVGEATAACGLTDADLASVAVAPPMCAKPSDDRACDVAVAAIVDLGEPVRAELVVVRGCEGGCAVEVSGDGTTFWPAGSSSDGFGAVALDGQPVRAVKVGLGSGIGLREVSVWGPAPADPLRSVGDEERAELASPYGDGSSGDEGPPTLLVVIAALAAAAVLVAAGVVLGRRGSAGTS